MATQKVLLLEDVGSRGRKGDIVDVKSGFARNCLLPQGRALRATKQAVRMQEALQAERAKQAAEDKAVAEKLAEKLNGNAYEFSVKVDQDGHMYGSVSQLDVQRRVNEQENLDLDRRAVLITQPIKRLGITEVSLRLNEGVLATIHVKVVGEGVVEQEAAGEQADEAAAPEGEEAAEAPEQE